jgi:asparagine synthase (glutamine-hydrolysing)
MSGILGVLNSQKPTPWQRMLDDLQVLGGDAKGDWCDRSVGLSLGRTQFFNTPESCYEAPVVEFQGCVLVWDGRLDDRQSLLAGRSSMITDAQLIVESYRRWSVDCLGHLTGEFVFILWDAALDLLLVGCDVVGGRTLAYYWDGQTLLLSSRVVTLLLHPQTRSQLDELYLAHTLCNLHSHTSGSTPFEDIKRLRPGFALIIRSGQLQERKIAGFVNPEGYDLPKSSEIYYDKFWHLLNQAVKDRLRSHRQVCTTLSGGLDSTTVTVSLLNHLPNVDAFSIVTDIYPEFNERQPILSFLQQYPQVKWHEVNCDRAWSLSEPWEHLPVTDDPIVTCTLPMNLQVMQQIQQQGFGLVFDGEWGDEIFYTSLEDLARAGSWAEVLRYLKTEKRWHSTVWRELVVPHLSQYWQKKWIARCQRRSNPFPPWVRKEYVQKPETQRALQEYWKGCLSTNLLQIINWAIASGYSVASNQVYRLMRSGHQLEFSSPLQDKRLIEFALNLHPSVQNHLVYGKIFLRQANQGKLPEELLWRPKDNYFDPLKYAGIGQGEKVLELLQQMKSLAFLEEIFDFQQVELNLQSYRRGYSENYSPGKPYLNDMANKLYQLFSFVAWYQQISHK